MPGPSFALQQFLESFHAPRSDRRYADDFHLGALAQLSGMERERAERLLLARLQGDDLDDRVAGALAVLESKAAVKPLRDALERATGLTRVRIAGALNKLDPKFDSGAVLVDAIATGDFVTRGTAIRELSSGSPALARDPLLTSLTDPSFSVRVSAFGALLSLFNLKALREPKYSRLRTIGMRLLSDFDAVITAAAAEMRAIIDGLDDDKSPEDLNLDDTPTETVLLDRVMNSLGSSKTEPPWNYDLDLGALTQLEGDGRRFAECVLLAELNQRDPRITRALAAMRSTHAIQPLREALEVFKGDARDEVAHALEQLSGDET